MFDKTNNKPNVEFTNKYIYKINIILGQDEHTLNAIRVCFEPSSASRPIRNWKPIVIAIGPTNRTKTSRCYSYPVHCCWVLLYLETLIRVNKPFVIHVFKQLQFVFRYADERSKLTRNAFKVRVVQSMFIVYIIISGIG